MFSAIWCSEFPRLTLDTTIVGGRVLMENRKLALNLDEGRVNARARELAKDLWKQNVTMKTTNQAPGPITYDLIRKRAKAMEKDTARFLCDLVRTQSFSSKEKNVIAVIKKEMQKIGFDGIRIDGLGQHHRPHRQGQTRDRLRRPRGHCLSRRSLAMEF